MTGSRCRAAAIPDDVEFATKPYQARMMLERAIEAGVPFRWFTADEAYRQNPGLRTWLEEQDVPYVMATRRDDEIPSGLFTTTRVDALIGKARAGAWTRMSCGDGAHGPRLYDWPVCRSAASSVPTAAAGSSRAGRSPIRRRSPTTCATGNGVPRLRELVRVAGSRWAIEESFQTAKNEVGLDQYQVRRYDAWYAHITLAMAAAAFLAATRATETEKGAAIPKQTHSSDSAATRSDASTASSSS